MAKGIEWTRSGDSVGIDQPELKAEAVHEALRAQIGDGLPARLTDPVGPLLDMRGTIARSVKPEDSLSRVDALNQLLKQLIRKWPKENERAALGALYGIEKGYTGRTLTERRDRAAQHLGYETTHFRKNIEPRLIADFAVAVWQDHLRYTPRTKHAPAAVEASGDSPVLGPGDYNDQEELVSRIWSEVYGLRAEIIAGQRTKKVQSRHDQLPETKAKILWRTARLLAYIHEYLERYGERIIQGETEWQVEGLIRLAGWRNGVTDDEGRRLRLILAASGFDDWTAFS
jgi:hypothetical protein